MAKGIKVDRSKCTGCQVCRLVCSGEHVKSFKPSEARIKVMDKFPEPADFEFKYCIQCDEHPCVDACPAEAIKLDEALGIYKVDKDACTGCGSCVEACPHEGIWLDPTGTYAMKCDLCEGSPQCVEICPKKALSR